MNWVIVDVINKFIDKLIDALLSLLGFKKSQGLKAKQVIHKQENKNGANTITIIYADTVNINKTETEREPEIVEELMQELIVTIMDDNIEKK